MKLTPTPPQITVSTLYKSQIRTFTLTDFRNWFFFKVDKLWSFYWISTNLVTLLSRTYCGNVCNFQVICYKQTEVGDLTNFQLWSPKNGSRSTLYAPKSIETKRVKCHMKYQKTTPKTPKTHRNTQNELFQNTNFDLHCENRRYHKTKPRFGTFEQT